MTVRASTRVAGVIGSPVAQSLSPVLHNTAFTALGLDWVYVAFDVAEGAVIPALAGARALGLAGLSVTMPHKTAVAEAVDVLSADATVLHAVNCVVFESGRLIGHNTDGGGFIDSLARDVGITPAGRRCVVIGAGGAARAVIRALAAGGAAEVTVVNRTGSAAQAAAALAGPAGRVGEPSAVRDADLVVNATPVGMGAGGEIPVEPGLLRAGQVVADLVYHPVDTALLRSAREAGAVALDGIGMLVHQAARAFRLWTGVEPPTEAMTAAARRELRKN